MNKANETLAFYRGIQLNDKSLFIDNLGWLLSQTREQYTNASTLSKVMTNL